MPALLDDTGLQIPTLDEIRLEITEDWKAAISDTLDVEEESALGEIAGAIASRIRTAYELLQATHASRDPDQAEGFALDGLAALTGTIREPATYSYVNTSCNLDAGTYAAGSLIAHITGDPSKRFANVDEIVSAGGLSSGHRFQALTTGPIAVNASTLGVIAEAVTGWIGVSNGSSTTASVSGYLGTDTETTTELRARREVELTRPGSTTVDAIRADILDLAGVTSCTVIENVTDSVDANGLPAHSVAAVVRGGTAAEIAAAIQAAKAAGIATHGAVTTNVTDDQGVDHSIKHSVATQIPLYCEVELTAIQGEYGGDDAVKTALVAEFGSMLTGKDVKSLRGYKAIMGVAGVVDVTTYLLDNVDPPVSAANIAVDWDEYADLDLTDVVVTSTILTGYP